MTDGSGVVMEGVREYAEDFEVKLAEADGPTHQYGGAEQRDSSGFPRAVIEATNEGGCNGTQVDLLDLIAWLKAHKPELLK
ncbi:MAG TPA: hypothetical protein VM537_03365 [Anaerolineae bacterium]|nr:hypothetical protein [Anaerolineae bacterium]